MITFIFIIINIAVIIILIIRITVAIFIIFCFFFLWDEGLIFSFFSPKDEISHPLFSLSCVSSFAFEDINKHLTFLPRRDRDRRRWDNNKDKEKNYELFNKDKFLVQLGMS